MDKNTSRENYAFQVSLGVNVYLMSDKPKVRCVIQSPSPVWPERVRECLQSERFGKNWHEETIF